MFLLSLVIWANLSITLTAAECEPDEHEYEIFIIQYATPEQDGVRELVCVNCGYSYTEDIPRSGHHFSEYEIEIEADCAHEGVKVRQCQDCGVKEYDIIPYTDDHSFGEWEDINEPLCTTDGLRQRRCTKCGTIEEQVIPATGEHSYEETIRPATCTEDGEKVYQCQNCDDSYTEKIAALGHKWGETVIVKAATVDEQGLTRRVCRHDHSHTSEEAIPKLPPETAATATETATETETETEKATELLQEPEPKEVFNQMDIILGGANFSTFWLFFLLIRRDFHVINWDKRRKAQLGRKGGRK